MDIELNTFQNFTIELRKELRTRGFKTIERSSDRNWYAVLASINNLITAEIWFGDWLNVPAFWVGLAAANADEMNHFLSRRPDLISEGRINDSDWTKAGRVKQNILRKLKFAIDNGGSILESFESPFYGRFFEPCELVRDDNTFLVANAADYLESLWKDHQVYPEGLRSTVVLSRWERSPDARRVCLTRHGAVCKVCGINFESVYGEIGRDFIHVHHLTPGCFGEREVDPQLDLVPVGPNCHAMLHSESHPLAPEELKKRLPEKLLNLLAELQPSKKRTKDR